MGPKVKRAVIVERKSLYLITVFVAGTTFLFPLLSPLVMALFFVGSKSMINFRSCFRESIKITIYMLLLLVPVIVFINYFSSFLLFDFTPQQSVVSIKDENSITISKILSLCLLAPVIEEIYFRGILLSTIKLIIGSFWAVLLSSIYFSIIHLNILVSPTLFVLGITLGIIAILTKSVLPSIILHALFNGLMIYLIL